MRDESSLRNVIFAAVLAVQCAIPAIAEEPLNPNNQPRWGRGFPGSKMAIENPVKRLISDNTSSSASPIVSSWRGLPGSKSAIETPLKRSITRDTSMLIKTADNGHVQPGLVAWLPDEASACMRSRVSGKPVLVFQMMGKLDDEFC